MDKPKITPKDFFLWAGAMIALYTSVFSFISLLFSYIDHVFPDALNSYIDPYSSAMRFYIASLIVLFPLFLYLMRVIRRGMEKDATRREIWVRRWALVLTIFVAAVTVAGDLITLINYFLGGDITTRFLLKVVVVLLVAAVGFLHFLADLRGYWDANPKRALWVGWGVGAVALCAVVAGFFIMGTPGQVRLYRFDDQKVSDLQNIQYQIVNYWQQKEKLPVALSDLSDPLSGFTVPADPQSGEAYTYATAGKMSFKLCATFNAETQLNSTSVPRAVPGIPKNGATGADLNALPWTHAAGEQCLERTIDPERYPPYSKTR